MTTPNIYAQSGQDQLNYLRSLFAGKISPGVNIGPPVVRPSSTLLPTMPVRAAGDHDFQGSDAGVNITPPSVPAPTILPPIPVRSTGDHDFQGSDAGVNIPPPSLPPRSSNNSFPLNMFPTNVRLDLPSVQFHPDRLKSDLRSFFEGSKDVLQNSLPTNVRLDLPSVQFHPDRLKSDLRSVYETGKDILGHGLDYLMSAPGPEWKNLEQNSNRKNPVSYGNNPPSKGWNTVQEEGAHKKILQAIEPDQNLDSTGGGTLTEDEFFERQGLLARSERDLGSAMHAVHRGDFSGAKRLLNDMLDNTTDEGGPQMGRLPELANDPRVWLTAGLVAWSEGDKDKARGLFKTAGEREARFDPGKTKDTDSVSQVGQFLERIKGAPRFEIERYRTPASNRRSIDDAPMLDPTTGQVQSRNEFRTDYLENLPERNPKLHAWRENLARGLAAARTAANPDVSGAPNQESMLGDNDRRILEQTTGRAGRNNAEMSRAEHEQYLADRRSRMMGQLGLTPNGVPSPLAGQPLLGPPVEEPSYELPDMTYPAPGPGLDPLTIPEGTSNKRRAELAEEYLQQRRQSRPEMTDESRQMYADAATAARQRVRDRREAARQRAGRIRATQPSLSDRYISMRNQMLEPQMMSANMRNLAPVYAAQIAANSRMQQSLADSKNSQMQNELTRSGQDLERQRLNIQLAEFLAESELANKVTDPAYQQQSQNLNLQHQLIGQLMSGAMRKYMELPIEEREEFLNGEGAILRPIIEGQLQ